MENDPMGRVTTEATIENSGDLWAADQGFLPERRVELQDALVDTGATLISLPTSTIHRLGLKYVGPKRITSAIGPAEASMYSAVRLTIQGRSCTMDVMEVSDGIPALIGQIPLEHLDFVIDMKSRTLVGNPAHGGEQVYELY